MDFSIIRIAHNKDNSQSPEENPLKGKYKTKYTIYHFQTRKTESPSRWPYFIKLQKQIS
jgi:hypothetical protein